MRRGWIVAVLGVAVLLPSWAGAHARTPQEKAAFAAGAAAAARNKGCEAIPHVGLSSSHALARASKLCTSKQTKMKAIKVYTCIDGRKLKRTLDAIRATRVKMAGVPAGSRMHSDLQRKVEGQITTFTKGPYEDAEERLPRAQAVFKGRTDVQKVFQIATKAMQRISDDGDRDFAADRKTIIDHFRAEERKHQPEIDNARNAVDNCAAVRRVDIKTL